MQLNKSWGTRASGYSGGIPLRVVCVSDTTNACVLGWFMVAVSPWTEWVVGTFSTTNTRDKDQSCSWSACCARLAASSYMTAASRGYLSRINRWRELVWGEKHLSLQSYIAAWLNTTHPGLLLSDSVKDRNITGHMANIFDW